MQVRLLSPVAPLQEHVECIRIVEHAGEEDLAINVFLNGLPGIVFQHQDGRPPVEQIMTRSGRAAYAPTLYVYGQMTEPSVMHHKPGPFKTMQMVLKPHALQTLLGINAAVLTNAVVNLAEFSSRDLNTRLLDAADETQRMTLLTQFLLGRLHQTPPRDCLIEESLRLIHIHIGSITVKDLLDWLSISERHFERRFNQVVGVSPHFYIRIKRFNEAIRLMKMGYCNTLTEVAHTLNFYDQSHFIRDMKAFSGLTPKHLLRKADEIDPDQKVYSYT